MGMVQAVFFATRLVRQNAGSNVGDMALFKHYHQESFSMMTRLLAISIHICMIGAMVPTAV